MKTMNKTTKIAAIVAIGFSLFAGGLLAGNRELGKQLHEQLSKFRQEQVQPEMLNWKQELDAAMSSDDLQALNELRAEAAELRSEMKAMMKERMKKGMEMRRSGQRPDKETMRAHREQMEEGREAIKEKMETMAEKCRPLMKKYDETLESISDKANDKRKEWKETIKQIRDTWKENNEEAIEAAREKMSENKDRPRRGHPMRKMRNHRDMMPDLDCSKGRIRFMLWDGVAPEDDDSGPGNNEMINSVEGFENDNGNVRNYPNPFQSSTKIEFELPRDENVKITISDASGKVIGTLYEGNLNSGSHSFDFNADNGKFGNLSSGVYFYKIDAESFNKSGRMTLNK